MEKYEEKKIGYCWREFLSWKVIEGKLFKFEHIEGLGFRLEKSNKQLISFDIGPGMKIPRCLKKFIG
jgi:hypothetical protein